MKRTIELTRIVVDGDTIKYEIHDNTGLGLLRKEKVEAQIQFHNADAFGFEPDKLPESVLAIPIMLYLLPVTFFLPYRTHTAIHGPYSLSQYTGIICSLFSDVWSF